MTYLFFAAPLSLSLSLCVGYKFLMKMEHEILLIAMKIPAIFHHSFYRRQIIKRKLILLTAVYGSCIFLFFFFLLVCDAQKRM